MPRAQDAQERPTLVHPCTSCPALFVAAPASGQGKTTVTAALARRYRDRGLRVRVFKTGPDFLDPMILERASGQPVYQLDLWMGGEDHCRHLLYEAAGDADLILIEGVMGLYDGNPSSADFAARFGIPVLAVIDGSAMAQTFGAVAHGLATYRKDLPFAGVLANRVAGERHYRMLAESLPPGLTLRGWLPREADIALPDRHLGLMQAGEIADLDTRLERSAAALMLAGDARPVPVAFAPAQAATLPKLLAGVRIAVANDTAFSFLYRANLDVLHKLGAGLRFFSPLADPALPEAEALYLPGGYPELHLERLAANQAMKQAIRAHHTAAKPILAECGGMLYLVESLTDAQGRSAEMAELLPGRAVMQPRLVALALQSVALPEGELRGHTFHHSRLETTLVPIARGACPNGGKTAEAVYRAGRLTASYTHFYFPSNPEAVAGLFLP
ncbi:MAG: cobyrinic acid a,c-diamide synthase [Candidatus Muproteobacteria bacterium RBG_16_64_11]|uniref:Cobyrinate a,c-diamide synthase n=1 Tax=Candidatus Muproteobacteria bacterium RBG_16_64_11 TaxID=1817758 RepID=A0A1F6TAJ0_9PROT|nr:MAG: cobyrinic acid a,c-diamide synthase [Candidatus Muproteobacteria bacterium RBG_16_64_11]